MPELWDRYSQLKRLHRIIHILVSTYEVFMSFASVTSPCEAKCSLSRSSDKCLGKFLTMSRDLNNTAVQYSIGTTIRKVTSRKYLHYSDSQVLQHKLGPLLANRAWKKKTSKKNVAVTSHVPCIEFNIFLPTNFGRGKQKSTRLTV
jgi:hypothetical protein